MGKIFKIGKLPFNANIAAYYNVVRPDIGPDWTDSGAVSAPVAKGFILRAKRRDKNQYKRSSRLGGPGK